MGLDQVTCQGANGLVFEQERLRQSAEHLLQIEGDLRHEERVDAVFLQWLVRVETADGHLEGGCKPPLQMPHHGFGGQLLSAWGVILSRSWRRRSCKQLAYPVRCAFRD